MHDLYVAIFWICIGVSAGFALGTYLCWRAVKGAAVPPWR